MYKVIENWLPKELKENMIEVMTSDWFPWFYHDYVATQKEKSGDEYYFTHTFFDDVKKEINSGFYEDLISPVLFLIGNNLPLIRAKANLFTKRDKRVVYGYHSDYNKEQYKEHTTFVLSLNTNDGYTEFEDGTKVPSIEGQMLIFDGHVKHRSVGQTDTLNRINININLEGDFKNYAK